MRIPAVIALAVAGVAALGGIAWHHYSTPIAVAGIEIGQEWDSALHGNRQIDELLRRGYRVECTYSSAGKTHVILAGRVRTTTNPHQAAAAERIGSEWQALHDKGVRFMRWQVEHGFSACSFCSALDREEILGTRYAPAWPPPYCACDGARLSIVENTSPSAGARRSAELEDDYERRHPSAKSD